MALVWTEGSKRMGKWRPGEGRSDCPHRVGMPEVSMMPRKYHQYSNTLFIPILQVRKLRLRKVTYPKMHFS